MSDAVLLESPQFSTISTPSATTRISDQAYVLSLTSLPSYYAACTSAPSNTIDLFDKNTLTKLQVLPGHDVASTSMRTVDTIAGSNGPCLVSSGKDGSIKVWDERSNTHGIKMTDLGKSRSLFSFDVSVDGFTVAAGTELQGEDALILYWDPRQPAAPLRTHGSTHSDDITALQFSKDPSAPHVILSASSDGLISTSNAEETDEDEAAIQVGNWGCSVSQAGWITSSQSSGATIWAASDMETFSTWSGELDQLQSQDIRSPCIHSGSRTWVTDYLITCQSAPVSEHGLGVFVGSNEGDVALLSNMNLSAQNAPWTLHKLWSNGHEGVVRSLLWDDQNHVLVTGGEDSRINVWSGLPEGPGGADISMDVDRAPPSSKRRDVDWQEEQESDRDGENVELTHSKVVALRKGV